MNFRSLLLVPFLLSAGFFLLAPRLGPKRLFFGVRVQPDFRATQPARQALVQYEWAVAAVTFIGLLWLIFHSDSAHPGSAAAALVTVQFLQPVVAAIFWLRNYRALRQYEIGAPSIASVELTTEPDNLPSYFWMLVIPPLILGATAIFLSLHWSAIPARFPNHWGDGGEVNGWGTRSVRGVYGPLLFAALLMVWLIGMAFATWYGTRRSAMRVTGAKMMIAVELLIGFVFSLNSLQPLHLLSGALLTKITLGSVAAILIYSVMLVHRCSDSDEEIAVTYTGFTLFDRQNSAVLLPRGDGLGYCPNLAHPVAWVLVLYPMAVAAVSIKFLF